MAQAAVGLLFVVWVWLSAFCLWFFAFFPLTALGLFALGHVPACRALFRSGVDVLAALWFRLGMGIIEVFGGTKVVLTGDPLPSDEAVLLVCNHRTRLDWLYLWALIGRYGRLENFKIIPKAALRHVPAIGWAMQVLGYLFLRRNWQEDEQHMRDVLTFFSDSSYPLQLLLFPEGTDLQHKSLQKSAEFAAKNNLPAYEYCLHPRTTGFVHTVQLLRSSIHSVYDVSIAYEGTIPQKEISLVKGDFPKALHVNVQRFPIQDLPREQKDLELWLAARWAKKEESLATFYRTGNFPGAQPLPLAQAKSTIYIPVFLMMAALTVWSMYVLVQSSWVRWYCLLTCVVSVLYTMYGPWSIDVERLKYAQSKSKVAKA